MDEINQIQNPNIPPMSSPPSGPAQPMNPIPSMPQAVPKKDNYWFWIVIAVILVVGALVWWYVNQMAIEAPTMGQPQINKEAREDIMMSNDIEGTDLGDLNKEFMEVDKDLNSL